MIMSARPWATLIFAFFLSGLLIAPERAQAQTSREALFPYQIRHDGKGRIPGLKLQKVVAEPDGKNEVVLYGSYKRENWSLVIGAKETKRGADGGFSIPIPLKDGKQKIQIIAIGPMGDMHSENVYISPALPEDEKPANVPPGTAGNMTKLESDEPEIPKRRMLDRGIGVTYISYKDQRIPDLTSISPTAKLTYTKEAWSPEWEFSGGAFFTLFNVTNTAEESLRFFGVNARLGYDLPFVRYPWKVKLTGGAYYTTMFVGNEKFGFRNMKGPQLFPVVMRDFGKGRFSYSYLKYAPVTSGFADFGGNRELAFGGGYKIRRNDGTLLGFSLDIAHISMVVEEIPISSFSATLGVSYGF